MVVEGKAGTSRASAGFTWHRRRSLRRSASGQSMVEFVLVIPMILLLLTGIFEFGRHYYPRLTLRNAVAEAARFAVTGRTLLDPDTGQPMTRAESIVQVILDKARGLAVDVNNIQINPSDGGLPGQVVTVSATYRYTFFFNPVATLP